MKRYAFLDDGAGYYQGAYDATDVAAAIRQYDDQAGLIPEIRLDLHFAEITPEQEAALDEWAARGHSNLDEELVARIDTVEWTRMSDADVREILGYAPAED